MKTITIHLLISKYKNAFKFSQNNHNILLMFLFDVVEYTFTYIQYFNERYDKNPAHDVYQKTLKFL